MNKLKYRWAAFILTLVFSLYNVGLPIVISACPMMSAKNAKLACCADIPIDGVKISSTKNTSCCQIVIAAKPNKTEYLQVKIQFEYTNSISHVFVENSVIFDASNSFSFSATSSFSPPHRVKDIPVFTSSLII